MDTDASSAATTGERPMRENVRPTPREILRTTRRTLNNQRPMAAISRRWGRNRGGSTVDAGRSMVGALTDQGCQDQRGWPVTATLPTQSVCSGG